MKKFTIALIGGAVMFTATSVVFITGALFGYYLCMWGQGQDNAEHKPILEEVRRDG